MAQEHYECRLLLRVLLAWQSAVRLAGIEKKQLQEQQVHRRKMDALLRAAAAMKDEGQWCMGGGWREGGRGVGERGGGEESSVRLD